MRVAVVGRTHWLLESAELLVARGHKIALVATTAPAPEYRVREANFAIFAERNKAPFFDAPDINGMELINALTASGADVAVSINWPNLIRRQTCEALRFGFLNAHAGDLPRYRGNACANWAILNDEPEIGLCVHTMDPDHLDAGPILARDRLPLSPQVYIGDVYAWLDCAIPALFVHALDNLGRPGFSPEDQASHSLQPLRTHPRRPEDGLIDWRCDVAAIARLIRASSRPFAGAFSYLEGQERFTIWRGRAVTMDYEVVAVPGQILGRGANSLPLVACGKGVLEIEEHQSESGRSLPGANRYRLTAPRGAN